MRTYEQQYEDLVRDVLNNGEVRVTRNDRITKSLFGKTLTIDVALGFPLLNGRKMFYTGILGELCAILRGPKNISEFHKFGCKYWDMWGDPETGDIDIDYGNAWLDFGGFNQVDVVIDAVKNDPTNRRMLISGWRPDRLDSLSLPCCHYAYQFYVSDINGVKTLNMMWHQRSVDVMVGLPSDVAFAAAWLIAMSYFTNTKPGKIMFTLGDTHIYEVHEANALIYLNTPKSYRLPAWSFNTEADTIYDLLPQDYTITGYNPKEKLKFELLV